MKSAVSISASPAGSPRQWEQGWDALRRKVSDDGDPRAPYYDLGFELERVRRLHLGATERDAIAGANLARLLDVG